MPSEDKARRRLGDNPGLAAELGGAIAFAFANGCNRGIVRVDNFTVAQRLGLRQTAGLGFDPLMRLECGRELSVQTRPLLPRQGYRAMEGVLAGPRQRGKKIPLTGDPRQPTVSSGANNIDL
jgi:hypothetical protein